MNTKELRRYITENIKSRRDDNIDLDFIGSEYTDIGSNHMHGFFNIMHSKSNEEKYLRKELKLAKDSQVIYEFVQNARDAKASEICIYYNSEHFLVINNGNKFNENDISSILDIGQSSKDISDDNIGSFGVGFKIVHRLVGSDDGLEEIVTKYNGPILFSWDDDGFKQFMDKKFENLSPHWLFKILYTCFPCGLNERVLNRTREEEIFFKQNEVEKIIQLIEAYSNITNFKNGSLFFISLGSSKYELLKKEENELKKGLEYSLNLLDIDKKSKLSKITINDNVVEKKDMISLTLCNDAVTLLFHKDYQEKLDFYKQKNSRISFYTYFPMSDQKENLNFIIHSSKFDYKTDRRQLSGKKNDVIIKEIAKEFIEKLEIIKVQEQEKYISILQDLYLSSLSLNYNSINEGIQFLKHETLKYIEKNIPFVKVNSYGIDILEITDDKTQVVIIDSKVDIPIKMKHNFYFSLEKYEDIVKRAESKLKLTRWNIIKALLFDDITKWILELENNQYNILLKEIEKEKRNYSQDIVNKWKGIFTLKEIKRILEIFKVLDKDKIEFAVIKISKDKYEIIPSEKNHYIKGKDFKEFLEQSYELCEMNIFLIPEEIEDDILSIIGNNNPSDKKIMNDLLECNQHRELVSFIEEFELEKKYLNTLERLDLDTSIDYENNSFELKTLDFILKMDENIEIYKQKIFINELQISQLSKSPFITFKYQSESTKVINPSSHANTGKNSEEILNFIEKIGRKYKAIFTIEEESKDKVYEKMKSEIQFNHKLNNKINSKNRLKFIVLYSLEKEENFIKDFHGINIFNHEEQKDESFDRLYKVFTKDIKLKSDNQLNIFHISDFFPEEFKKDSYYIEDKNFAIETEKLPETLEKKYIKTFSQIGLTIEQELPILRKKLLYSEDIKRDDLISFNDAKLTNSLEFLFLQDKVYDFDSVDTRNIKYIFKLLESSTIENFEFLPILKTKSSFSLQRLYKYITKEYITKESIESSNQVFQERLDKEIEQKDLIYLDILDLDNPPIGWEKVVENEDEKITEKREILNKQEQEFISAETKKDDKDISQSSWLIGWRGEKYVYSLLIDKFGIDNVTWYNENSTSYHDDKGGIDFKVKDQNSKILNIEVKTTTGSIYSDSKIKFTLSSKQFEAARSWGRDTHLIFVSGIGDNKPELLYMNFDNNWLDPNNQKESLDTSFLSKKEDNLVNPFTLEEKQLSDEKSIINLTKFKSEKNNEVINKLGVIIRRLNKTNLNTNEKISFINSMNNPIIEFSEILQEINTKVK